jgi:2-(1,2-epoxy-1,2-dihydrophenyl)acetyl-CoA isomerase
VKARDAAPPAASPRPTGRSVCKTRKMPPTSHAADGAEAATGNDPVLVSLDGAVATVTINRPEQANSLTAAAKEALLVAVEALANNEGVRAVVLTGSGRAFCAGQDLGEHAGALANDPSHAFDTVRRHYGPIVQSLATMPKPVIAAVNGTCAGAGIGFALACDLRVAASGAKFAPAFTGIGLTADSGLSMTLARAVGWSRAMGLLLLGTVVDAEEAERIGLVHEVVPADKLASAVSALAARLAAGPTMAYAALKEALWYSASADIGAVLELEAQLQARLASTKDHRQAVDAFLEKRRPEFTGT